MIQPSENVHLIDISLIQVGERLRTEINEPKLAELTSSIKRNGLLHPIVLTRSLELVAGASRLTAAKRLGWTEIPARFLDECDEFTHKEIELEENLARAEMSFIDIAQARAKLHDIKVALYGQANQAHTINPSVTGWSLQHTADALGITKRQLQSDRAIVAAIQVLPELAFEDSKATILKKIDRLVEDIEYQIRLIDANQAHIKQIESNLWLGDCINELAKLPTESVDLILTDPPYGIDYDSVGGSSYRTEIRFDDAPEAVLSLLRSALREMRRVLKRDGHLYAFYGIQLWSETFAVYRSQGFEPDPLPLVWVKNTTAPMDWDYRYANSWEPIIFCGSPDRRLARKRSNVFAVSAVSRAEQLHANEKPLELLRELIEMSTRPGELVLDPFAGSGSTLVAAKQLDRQWLGIEADPRSYDIAKLRLLG